jgi:hypothetical protein
MANGVVKSVRLLTSACGYEVVFQDSGGARWHYQHLDRPSLREGTVLFQGAIIGVHRNYPKSGCGSGPHLHLERHSAGAFGDKEVMKTCRRGTKTCNWNAKAPLLGKRVLRSASEASALQERTRKATQDAKGYSTEVESIPLTEMVFIDSTPLPCAPNQPPARLVAALPTADSNTEAPGGAPGGADTLSVAPTPGISARAKIIARPGLPGLVELTARAQRADGELNETNTCADGPCVAAWTLYARTPAGWSVTLSDEGTRESPVGVSAEQKLCWPQDATGQWALEATIDSSGTTRRAIVMGSAL